MIRPLGDHDIPKLARLWRELRPDAVHSEQGLRHLVESFPPRAEAAHWIADDGAVVAWCFAHRRWRRASSNGYVWIGVLPEARRRGLGTELWELAERHLSAIGVERVNADAVGDAGGEHLRRRGFVQRRTVVVSAVDPRLVDPAEVVARRERVELDGYRLLPYAEADRDSLYRLDMEAIDDEPGEEARHEQLMLAINRRLGYVPFVERRGFVKELSGRAETASGPARAAPGR